jgi:hypothetical protein
VCVIAIVMLVPLRFGQGGQEREKNRHAGGGVARLPLSTFCLPLAFTLHSPHPCFSRFTAPPTNHMAKHHTQLAHTTHTPTCQNT